jgi:hypothetical protein
MGVIYGLTNAQVVSVESLNGLKTRHSWIWVLSNPQAASPLRRMLADLWV